MKLKVKSCSYLVVYLLRCIWKSDGLGEDAAILLQLFAFRPVVECTGHIDIGGWMLPATKKHVSDTSQIAEGITKAGRGGESSKLLRKASQLGLQTAATAARVELRICRDIDSCD